MRDDRPDRLRAPRAAWCAMAMGLLLLSGCGREERAPPSVDLADCRLERLSSSVRCATLDVPEDRRKPDGRRIGIFVAVLPANTLDPRPDPLLVIAGGPGQAASGLGPFAARLVEVRRERDVVLIDQRGTGRSSRLACPAFGDDQDPLDALDLDPLPRARRCLEELAAQGVDVTRYTTADTIADFEAVRTALGYPRWNLWGGSYGSRVALEYVRAHPGRVRSMVLDGVAPPSLKVPAGVWTTREEALDAVFTACAQSTTCARMHPDPAGLLSAVRESLGVDGQDFEVADPRTGNVTTHRVTGDALIAALHPLTYLPELASLIPVLLVRAAAGDFAPTFAVTQMVTQDLAKQMSIPLHYAVTCAEDAPRLTTQEREALARLRSASLAKQVLAVCDIWPRGDGNVVPLTPLQSSVPALLLSGGLDPVTPPRYAQEVGRTLASHRAVVATGFGHIVSPHACGPGMLAAFIDAADPARLPQRCVEFFERSVRPPIWLDTLAPRP